jgi:hypothetical protein
MTLDKHGKYKSIYGEKEVFWGLGIEEETYFQFSKPIQVAAPILRTAQKPERYSVSYYKSYLPETLELLKGMFTDVSGFYPLPFFFNAHAFTKMDSYGKHTKTYDKHPKPNPAFRGKTLFEGLQEFCPEFFQKEHEGSFTFDGDTIEFITQKFYKAKAKAVIKELTTKKKIFLDQLNLYCKKNKVYQQYGSFMYPPINPGFSIFYSNPLNVAIFNNGTYHINITLPSLLGPKDADGMPTLADPGLFRQQHKNCIRIFQWMEPLLIAMYGTADPFSNGTKASQRCAMSRYTGIGTYNTEEMPEGKIVTKKHSEIRGSSEPFWWYKVYHEKSAYKSLDELGMDINYKKHFSHGIELRIFDWFPEKKLQEVIRTLVYCAEASLKHKEVLEPAMSTVWNDLVVRVLREGGEAVMDAKDIGIYDCLLGIPLLIKKGTVRSVFSSMTKLLYKKYKNGGLSKMFF